MANKSNAQGWQAKPISICPYIQHWPLRVNASCNE